MIGVLNLTPHHYWRKMHAIHHAHSGDLDVRTFGDIHHLSARTPNYRLQRCHDDNPDLWQAPTMTMWDGLETLHLALWDEGRRKLISFHEYRRLRAAERSCRAEPPRG